MGRIDQVYRMLEIHAKDKAGLTALELGQLLALDRATVSRYLNRLSDAGRVEKLSGRPVRYRLWAGGTASGWPLLVLAVWAALNLLLAAWVIYEHGFQWRTAIFPVLSAAFAAL